MKVGDYVRTDIGIGKYISDNEIQFRDGKGKATYRDIIKSSPNIIDLIEVGDYVNGEKVCAIGENSGDVYIRDLQEFILAKEIKSIVTREIFESMKYKVGE